jgi:organic hydroperoxide reductase OsmC/OhrA
MASHTARILWTGDGADFTKGRFSRAHTWSFDGGITVAGSSSPSVVPVPLSNAEAIDPEEAFVASLSSCHMLTFLFHAARKGFSVTRYEDDAAGTLSKNEKGKFFISKVALAPKITFGGEKQPNAAELAELHHLAHEDCFIANSVLTEVSVG